MPKTARSLPLAPDPFQLISRAAFKAFDRLCQPGSCLLLIGTQTYILSGKCCRHYSVKERDLEALIEQGLVAKGLIDEQGRGECFLTEIGHAHRERLAVLRANSGKYKQLAFSQLAKEPEREVTHA